MNKIERYLFGGIILIALIIIVILGITKNNNNYEIANKIIDKVMSDDDPKVVYIYPKDCSDCEMQSYQMKFFVHEYKLKYYNISLEGLNHSKRKTLFKKLGLEENDDTLSIAVYKNKKLNEYIKGMTNTKDLYNMLNKYDLLSKKELPINYLTITNYVDKVANGLFALQIGSFNDANSNKMEELLWNIAIKYNQKLDYINLSDLTNIEGELFESKLSNFIESKVVIPSLLIIDNGIIIDKIIGIGEENEYVELLKKYDIIN